jgi:hypothetical protein
VHHELEADEVEQQLAEQLSQLQSHTGNGNMMDQQSEAAAVAAAAQNFPWERLQDTVGNLIQRGRAGGWIAEPSQVSVSAVLAHYLNMATLLTGQRSDFSFKAKLLFLVLSSFCDIISSVDVAAL